MPSIVQSMRLFQHLKTPSTGKFIFGVFFSAILLVCFGDGTPKGTTLLRSKQSFIHTQVSVQIEHLQQEYNMHGVEGVSGGTICSFWFVILEAQTTQMQTGALHGM